MRWQVESLNSRRHISPLIIGLIVTSAVTTNCTTNVRLGPDGNKFSATCDIHVLTGVEKGCRMRSFITCELYQRLYGEREKCIHNFGRKT